MSAFKKQIFILAHLSERRWNSLKRCIKHLSVYSSCVLDVLMYFEAVRFIWCFFCNKTSTSGNHVLSVWIPSLQINHTAKGDEEAFWLSNDCTHLKRSNASLKSKRRVLKWTLRSRNMTWECRLLVSAGSYWLTHYMWNHRSSTNKGFNVPTGTHVGNPGEPKIAGRGGAENTKSQSTTPKASLWGYTEAHWCFSFRQSLPPCVHD